MHRVVTVDTRLLGHQGVAASYLILDQGRAAFVDTGTGHAVPLLLAALAREGIGVQAVDYVIVTHVHLDHAGGAGGLMARLPNARLVVHPRGARHMIDPAKLIAGATAVYGEQRMQSHFGAILPIAAERVVEAPDGFEAQLGGRRLTCLDTPGHARHHLCVHDREAGDLYTGDAFGLSYRHFDTAAGPFIFPTTTPVQLDPEAMHSSIDRLMGLGARRIHLTHFGAIPAAPRLAAELHRHIDFCVHIARAHADAGERRGALIEEDLAAHLLGALQAHGCRLPEVEARRLLDMDLKLNTQGLEVWLDRTA
jgi:glyoxylase-like metal-dependent hydrolase (beta-lactamase superfamily II)